MKNFLSVISLTVLLSLGACSTLSGSTWEDKVGVAQATNTSLLRLVDAGVLAGKLSKVDALNLVKQIDSAEDGIKIAETQGAIAGTDKLAVAQQILNALQSYLVTKGVK